MSPAPKKKTTKSKAKVKDLKAKSASKVKGGVTTTASTISPVKWLPIEGKLIKE